MAEERARESPSANSIGDSKKETGASAEKSKSGLIVRLWRRVFGSGKEDYEKRLQYLSKEEATVHARLKRRAKSSRIKSRNIIVFSIILEVVAVAYAVMTTRSIDLDLKMRAIRLLPMFGLPVVSTLMYSALASFTRMLDRKDQKTLESLRAERQEKIDELKERTNYYTTQQLIQRYDLDPAAKQAAAAVLASKLGSDAGLKVYLGEDDRTALGRSADVEVVQSSGLRNRKQPHIKNNSSGSTALTQFIDETSVEYSADDQEALDRGSVEQHFKGPSPRDGGWFARIAALLVGEDPTQCYALICGKCHMHNGLARKEDFLFITYYCPHCHELNGSRQADDHVSSSVDGNGLGSITGSGASNLDTVQELPSGDENEELPSGDENEEVDSQQHS